MKTEFSHSPSFTTILLLGSILLPPGHAAQWPMKQGDAANTGRAAFTVPTERMNDTFFNALRWQKRTPGSPDLGNLSSGSMVFFDGAGPGGADLVASGYHWPKGVQGMDRHTGKFFWAGNPEGGETIGSISPAFSPDGTTLYVGNDATEHPLMAFSPSVGPSVYRHNGGDAQPWLLGGFSPKVAADGRIFRHQWNDRPYAATDDGAALHLSWSAESDLCACLSGPALFAEAGALRVIQTGRCGHIRAFDGSSGAELWDVFPDLFTDADATIDPASGNIYVPLGANSIAVAGVNKQGQPLWSTLTKRVYEWREGENHPQRAQSTGCLSHNGATFYFQTVSQEGDGRLYAVNTVDGSLKWSFDTGSRGWDLLVSSPIVTANGVIIVGNNEGGTYFALRDDGANATVLDTLSVASGGSARASATLSSDGLLYLPARLPWVQGNGDGEVPSQQAENLFNAFDLSAEPQVELPPPPGQRGRALNGAVELFWQPVAAGEGLFSHYAVYRATESFTSIAGMTPVGTVSNQAATGFVDHQVINGTAYHYAVTSVAMSGRQATNVQSMGPFLPIDESDLQVVSIARTPRFPRYAAEYTDYEISEPSGFGPYFFSAATGLGGGQTTNTSRWPALDTPVTYTVTVRNRGSNPWTNVHGVWEWDGGIASNVSSSVTLVPGAATTLALVRPWDGLSHEVTFRLTDADARPANNARAMDTKSVPFLSYVDQGHYDQFRISSSDYPNAATDDFLDFLNRHMDRFNQMFVDAGCAKRVHFDVLELLPDSAPTPALDLQPFAIFPLRYRAEDGSLRTSGYYNAAEDLDFGLLHEMGHQLGLIDLYQLNVAPEMNQVSGLGYSAIPCLMNGVSPFLSAHSSLAMSHWQEQAHGYFGQYLYGLPTELRLRILGFDGQPLPGATVKMYQMCERPGIGKVISPQIKAQGTTDAQGEFVLPNVPIDPAKVPTLPTGDVLHDNPFGYVAVVGHNGVLHFRIEYEGGVDYAWLDITEPNVAFYLGQTNLAVFDRPVSLGGNVRRYPPDDLTETNALDWVAWAQDSAAGQTYVTNDTSLRRTGTASMKFVTDGGFDTYVRYPGSFQARWDLSAVTHLSFWCYAENPNFSFQSGSPWIRLKDSEGNFFEYQFHQDGHPIDLLNVAQKTWQQFLIPLDASDTEENGWRRTAFGKPDLSQIQYLEIHADTWGYGFTLWLDGVGFLPSLRPEVTLSVLRQGDSVVLSWPATPSGFGVETAESVDGPYMPLNTEPMESLGMLSLSVPTSAAQQFFRLRAD